MQTFLPGLIAGLIANWTADQVVVSLIPAWFHIFAEIGREVFSFDPSADSKRVGVSYKRKYLHKVLVTR